MGLSTGFSKSVLIHSKKANKTIGDIRDAKKRVGKRISSKNLGPTPFPLTNIWFMRNARVVLFLDYGKKAPISLKRAPAAHFVTSAA